MAEPDEAYRKNLEVLVSTRTEQLRQSMFESEIAHDYILEAYSDALWLKDRVTAQHSKRVAVFSIALGQAMQLGGEEIRQAARTGLLHDIGKLAIPDAMLTKPTPLTEEEKQIMERHCVWGYEIVRKIKPLFSVAELIRAHHEHWDGKGYPEGLKGEMIPKGARIIAVVNTFDSISSDQPYRAARSFEYAVREITEGSGTQFDPQVVEAFLGVPQSTWRDISNEIEEKNQGFKLIH
jgi:putative nucleotidyltransferase with HDIG domain